jgi:hypothetical protein
MAGRYLAEMITPDALAAQERYYGRSHAIAPGTERDAIGAAERDFISRCDGFVLATVTRDGWPYVQHRGGPPGFLRVLDPRTLAFADFRGNRQLVSTGNLEASDRVALLLIDHARRQRLKIIGHAHALDAREHPALVEELAPAELRRKTERVVRIEVVGLDWNCPAYITPRYTEAELRKAVL